jgi:hypothetical protein
MHYRDRCEGRNHSRMQSRHPDNKSNCGQRPASARYGPLSSPRKWLTSDSSCPSSVPPLSLPIACEIGDRRDHGAAAGFPPGDSSEFRSTWLVFGQRLGVAHFDVQVVPSEQFSKWTQDASNAGRSLGQAFPAITLDVRASASGRVVRVRCSCASPNTRRLDTAGLDFVTSVVHSA